MRRAAAPVLVVTLAVLALVPAADAKLVYEKFGAQRKSLGIYLARDDGTHARQVRRGHEPYISPRGDRIAFFGARRFGLNVIDTDGRHHVIAIRGAYDGGPGGRIGWSADERWIVAAAAFEGEGRATLADLRTRAVRRAGKGDLFGGASFAPRGVRFAIADVSGSTDPRYGGSALVVFHARPFSSRYGGEGVSPVWGPRGLAFSRSANRREKIMLRDDGGHVRTLLSERSTPPGCSAPPPTSPCGSVVLDPVAWSADGGTLLVSETVPSESDTRPHPLLLRPDEGELVRVQRGLTAIWGLSGDGRHVLATRGREVVSVGLRGVVTVLAHNAGHPTWTN